MATRVRRVLVVSAILLILSQLGCQAPASQPAAPAAKTTAAPATTQAAPAAATTQTAPAAATTQAASQTSAAPATAAAAPQTIKIGIQMPLTGPYNTTPAKNWMQMAVDDINAAGGFKVGDKTYKIDPVIMDDKYTPDGQLDAANRLVLGEKVKFIVGCLSGCTSVVLPVTEPAKVLTLVMNPPDANLGQAHPFNFAIGLPTAVMVTPVLFDVAVKDNPNVKSVTLLFTDGPESKAYIEATKANAARMGLSYVEPELFPATSKDLSSVVLRLLQKKPDMVYLAGMGGSPTLFPLVTGALLEQGFKGVRVGASTYPTIVAAAGAAAEGFYGASLGDLDSPLVPAKMKELANRWIAKNGKDTFNADQIIIYDMVSVLVQAIQKAGTVDDTEKISQALRTGEFDGVAGKGRFTGVKTYGAPAVYSHQVFVSKFVGGKANILRMSSSDIP